MRYFRKNNNVVLLLLLLLLSLISCSEQSWEDNTKMNGYITVRSLNSPDNFSEGGADDIVSSFRILAFDAATGACRSNELYVGAALADATLSHPILLGKYDFIFLANEPSSTVIKTQLENITEYNDIRAIAYPATAFDSDTHIPMIAENKDVEVLPDGKIKVNDSELTVLEVNFRRLAARVDVLLKSVVDLGNVSTGVFKGVSFSNLPDRVPLLWGLPSDPIGNSWVYADPDPAYAGTGVGRNVTRKFTLADDTGYFNVDPSLLSNEEKAEGLVWAATVNRVIIPSSYFSDKSTETNGILFTVNLVDQYSPSCRLKILDDPDYTLPANARLELIGIIKEPLEMNIKASEWTKNNSNWNIGGEKALNVSHTSAGITDLNGIRISFSSTMPKVRILEQVLKDGTTLMETNTVFNDLAVTGTSNETTRFSYNPQTGNGYMDVIVDGGRNTLAVGAQSGVYTLVLSAEDENGNAAIQREIKITVTQNGMRFMHTDWRGNTQYTGIFFRNDEMGERIITGQHVLDKEWTVQVPVEYQDLIVVSSTPSFDPGVGTESPGKAEAYPVVPNAYKNEDGTKVTGKGRIYFRMGMKSKNPNVLQVDGTKKPRYGTVQLDFFTLNSSNAVVSAKHTFFIRQGEDPDYLYETGDIIEQTSAVNAQFQPLVGQARNAAARFSPYNLTAKDFKDETGINDAAAFVRLDYKSGAFVDYPSQSGAFFQWGLRLTDDASINNGISPFYRRAFNPYGNVKNATAWISSKGYNKALILAGGITFWNVMWGAPVAAGVEKHEDVFETCPPGYHRPSDGPVTSIATNGPTPSLSSPTSDHSDQIADSEWRVSLFTNPFSGDANSNADVNTIWGTGYGTYPPAGGRSDIVNTYKSFYADGYFDRRPILSTGQGSGYGVSLNTPRVAYVGLLFVNPDTKASLFFPHTGRISNDWADLQSRGNTGYYWSSSAAPIRAGDDYIEASPGTADRRISNGAWAIEIQYNWLMFRNTYADFGAAIRCVKD